MQLFQCRQGQLRDLLHQFRQNSQILLDLLRGTFGAGKDVDAVQHLLYQIVHRTAYISGFHCADQLFDIFHPICEVLLTGADGLTDGIGGTPVGAVQHQRIVNFLQRRQCQLGNRLQQTDQGLPGLRGIGSVAAGGDAVQHGLFQRIHAGNHAAVEACILQISQFFLRCGCLSAVSSHRIHDGLQLCHSVHDSLLNTGKTLFERLSGYINQCLICIPVNQCLVDLLHGRHCQFRNHIHQSNQGVNSLADLLLSRFGVNFTFGIAAGGSKASRGDTVQNFILQLIHPGSHAAVGEAVLQIGQFGLRCRPFRAARFHPVDGVLQLCDLCGHLSFDAADFLFHCVDLLLQRLGTGQIIVVECLQPLALKFFLLRHQLIHLVAAQCQFQRSQQVAQELVVVGDGLKAHIQERVLGDDHRVARNVSIHTFLRKPGCTLRIHAAGFGVDQELQLTPAGVNFRLMLGDQAVEQCLRRLLLNRCPVFRTLAGGQSQHIAPFGIGDELAVEQFQLSGAIRNDVILQVAQQAEISHIAVTGGVIVSLRMADQTVGEVILRVADDRHPLVQHLAAVGDEGFLHVSDTFCQRTEQFRGGIPVCVPAQFVHVLVQGLLHEDEDLIASSGIDGCHHAGDLVDLPGLGIVLGQHIQIPLQSRQLGIHAFDLGGLRLLFLFGFRFLGLE